MEVKEEKKPTTLKKRKKNQQQTHQCEKKTNNINFLTAWKMEDSKKT